MMSFGRLHWRRMKPRPTHSPPMIRPKGGSPKFIPRILLQTTRGRDRTRDKANGRANSRQLLCITEATDMGCTAPNGQPGNYGPNTQSGNFNTFNRNNFNGYYGPNNEARAEEGKFYYVDSLTALTNLPPAAEPANRSGFATHHFLPRGYKIPVILLNPINTSVGALPVELAIAKDVEFNGKIQLPFGWKVMATAQGGANHKVNVKVNMILDPLGPHTQ